MFWFYRFRNTIWIKANFSLNFSGFFLMNSKLDKTRRMQIECNGTARISLMRLRAIMWVGARAHTDERLRHMARGEQIRVSGYKMIQLILSGHRTLEMTRFDCTYIYLQCAVYENTAVYIFISSVTVTHMSEDSNDVWVSPLNNEQ